MQQTLIAFPGEIDSEIATLLSAQTTQDWLSRAEELHQRYRARERQANRRYIADETDVLAYLALRVPATYAQMYGAMTAVSEVLPAWKPQRILDLGSGPGVGVWAAKTIWPELSEATCFDWEKNFLAVGERISRAAKLPINIQWQQGDVTRLEGLGAERFDLVVLSNVLNELSPAQADSVLGQAWNLCSGVLLIVDAGTPFGSGIVSSAGKKLSKTGNLLAPYIDNQFVANDEFYLHFSQRFIRPEFSRRVRQRMRDDSLMASDWEEAKYSYVAIGKTHPEIKASGRCVGQVKLQKGFLELPVLTKDGIEIRRVMKREKGKYAKMKRLHWGELLPD